MESTDLKWRKASYSSNGGANCVEVGKVRHGVLVRDTKHRAGVVLRFTPGAWQRFADRVKRSLAGLQPSPLGASWCAGAPLGVSGPVFPLLRAGAGCRRGGP